MMSIKVSYYEWRRKRYQKKDRKVYDKVTQEIVKSKKAEK